MTGSQLGLALDGDTGHRMPPYQRGSATSREAARRMAPKAGTLQRRYLKALAAAGERGMTDWEAKAGLRCAYTSVQPRRAELNEKEERDWVVPSGHKRPGQSDVETVAWTLSERGREIVERMRGEGA